MKKNYFWPGNIYIQLNFKLFVGEIKPYSDMQCFQKYTYHRCFLSKLLDIIVHNWMLYSNKSRKKKPWDPGNRRYNTRKKWKISKIIVKRNSRMTVIYVSDLVKQPLQTKTGRYIAPEG